MSFVIPDTYRKARQRLRCALAVSRPHPLLSAATALALTLLCGCAGLSPSSLPAVSLAPRHAAVPDVPPPLLAVAAPEAAPVLDLVPPESPDLGLARSVLEARAPELDELEREGVARVLVSAEREQGLPVLMTLALIEQESTFRPRARSPRGALGLMQIRPFVGRDVARRHELPWHGERTLLDPVANVRIGTAFLAELREEFGTAELALAAYNIGPTRVRRRLAQGYSLEGPYVRKVMRSYDRLRDAFGVTETGIGG